MSVLDQDSLFADVLARLRAAAACDRPFDAAQMQLINLSEIIAQAGPHWPRIKDRVRTGSMNFLKGCLDPEDLVIPAGDGFLIIFASGHDTAANKARAEQLRLLLLEFYLGEEEFRRLGIEVSMRQLTPADIGALIIEPIEPSPEAASSGCMFAPIWSPGAQLIASYMCAPVHEAVRGLRHGYDKSFPTTGVNEHRDFCQVDLDIVDAACAALDRYEPGEARPAIGISVHSTTMQNKLARRAYLERLTALPTDYATSIFVKVAEIETGAPMITLADWAGMLRAHVRQVRLEFHASEPPPAQIADLGVWAAGVVSPPGVRLGGLDHERRLRLWGATLARKRVRFFVEHARAPALVRAAAEAGAAFVTCDALWPYRAQAGGVLAAPAPAAVVAR